MLEQLEQEPKKEQEAKTTREKTNGCQPHQQTQESAERHQDQNPRGHPAMTVRTSEPSGTSETNASNTSETSSTSSVGTLTRLHTDLSSYNSDGRHVVHVVPCAPTVPHDQVEYRSRLRESANSRANPRDTLEDQKIRARELVAIHDTIELRNNEGDLVELSSKH